MTEKAPIKKRSLRTLLIIWFLLFSVVPLAFLTGYSLDKYEQAIDQELFQRLDGNQRELDVIFSDLERNLVERVQKHAADKSLAFYLSQRQATAVKGIADGWMRSRLAPHRLSVFNREGRLEASLFINSSTGEVQSKNIDEKSDFFLQGDFLEKVKAQDLLTLVDPQFREGKLISFDLIAFSKIRTEQDVLVGYIEEVIELDYALIDSIKKRLGLELVFLSAEADGILTTRPDLESVKSDEFKAAKDAKGKSVLDIKVGNEPYGFIVRPIKWGQEEIVVAIGASKKAVQVVLKNINVAFLSVVGLIVGLLIILSLIISRVLLKPLSSLVSTLETADVDSKVRVEIDEENQTELGVLALKFNELMDKVHVAQQELRSNIKALEKANQEIKDTQTKLIHSAKMASLGQLVAGVAHELNNPIGFIYSNMGHLRDYSQKLMHLVQVGSSTPKLLEEEKKSNDFNYITQDLPKLIQSCEEGARRTRDIVLGLRNFSRLEETKLKEVSLEEGIEDTLRIIHGELKNRIEIHREYQSIPKVKCYPSELNQVFMNVLSNAAQAIEGTGDIYIRLKKSADKAIVEIQDSGKGMPAEIIDKIFDPFFTTKTIGKGTGLGLSISYSIVQKHEGEIQVESQLNKGTLFRIILPVNGPQTE